MRSASAKKDGVASRARSTTRTSVDAADVSTAPLDLGGLVTRHKLIEIAGIDDKQFRSFVSAGIIPPAVVRDVHRTALYPRAVAERIRDQLHLLPRAHGKKSKSQAQSKTVQNVVNAASLVPGDLPLELLPALLGSAGGAKRKLPHYSGRLAAAVFADLLDRKPLAHIVRDRAVRPDVLNCIMQEYQKLNGVGILTATATEKICDRLNLRTFDETVLLQFLDNDRCPSCHAQPKGLCVACSRKVLRDTIRAPMKPQPDEAPCANNEGAEGALEGDANDQASRGSATNGTGGATTLESATIPES